MKPFKDWREDVERQLEKLAPLLDAQMSDELGELEGQLRTIEAYGYRLIRLYSEAEVYLRIATGQFMRSMQGEKYTAAEKEAYTEEAVISENYIYRILKNLIGDRTTAGIIQRRISLGQTFLANHRALMPKGDMQ